MSYAAIYVAEFPIAAWLRVQPAHRHERLAVVEGLATQERVVALSDAAQAAGVDRGMSKVQAEAKGAPLFRHRRLTEEFEYFAELAEIANRFSPQVEDVGSPANGYGGHGGVAALLLLNCAGTTSLFGAVEQYADKLYWSLQQAGFAAAVATAPNAEAALLLAANFAGITCVDQVSLSACLAPLPVTCLSCAQATLVTLSRWGIYTLGDLAGLPDTALISRIGQQGRRLQQLARGTAEHLLLPNEEVFELCATSVLESPVELLESLLFVISPLLEQLLRKAVDHAYAIRSLHLQLQLERADVYQIRVRPAVTTQNRELLLKLVYLELQANPPQSSIVAVTLSAETAQPQTAQRGLFQSQFPEPDRLDLLLARLRSIAGESNVGTPQLLNSYRDDTFVVAEFRPHVRAADHASSLPSRLALRAVRPAQPVRVLQQHDRPGAIFWNGSKLVIDLALGPWHTSGNWWNDDAWNVDEWDAVLGQPQQTIRLQQRHSSRAWVIAGIYD